MFIGPCITVIVEDWKTNFMSLVILFHFLCAQHVSDINISIIRGLRLCCWITKSVVLFSVRCVLELWCGWFWVVFVLLIIINYFVTKLEFTELSTACGKWITWSVIRHVRQFAKSDCKLRRVCPSVSMEQLGSHRNIFREIWYLRNFRKSLELSRVLLKSDNSNGHLTW
jgi:uncharacterized membrane protein